MIVVVVVVVVVNSSVQQTLKSKLLFSYEKKEVSTIQSKTETTKRLIFWRKSLKQQICFLVGEISCSRSDAREGSSIPGRNLFSTDK